MQNVIRLARLHLRGSDRAKRSVDFEQAGQMVSASAHRSLEAKQAKAVQAVQP